MNENQESARNNHILSPFGARFASIKAERQVGKTGAHPSTPGCSKNPPQAVENRKITGVSV
jgi:hypothetical protein